MGCLLCVQSLILCSAADSSSATCGWDSAKKNGPRHMQLEPDHYSMAVFSHKKKNKNTLHGLRLWAKCWACFVQSVSHTYVILCLITDNVLITFICGGLQISHPPFLSLVRTPSVKCKWKWISQKWLRNETNKQTNVKKRKIEHPENKGQISA